MHKRGVFNSRAANEHSLWTLVEIVLVLLVVLGLYSFVINVKENRFFERSALSKDIALLMDTMQSVPGDVYVSYVHSGIDMSKYTFNFQTNRIQVEDSDSSASNSYPYYDDKNLVNYYDSPIKNPTEIQLMKTSSRLGVSLEVEQDFITRNCLARTGPELGKGAYIAYSTVLLEPLARALKQKLELDGLGPIAVYSLSQLDDMLQGKRLVLPDGFGYVFMLSSRDVTEEEGLPVTVISSNFESSKLSCFVSNSLRKNLAWASVVEVRQDSRSKTMPENGLGVVLELPRSPAKGPDFGDADVIYSLIDSLSSSVIEYNS
ncbi:hypothetical protein JXB31_01225 [Candidatus Woesearchaeota archaeon]|nr:hypothetical protein [Candidatus Woesearchaeota archaeon]